MKVTLVIEPIVAIINDQIKTINSKGVGKILTVFGVRDSDSVPQLAFCTPEFYLREQEVALTVFGVRDSDSVPQLAFCTPQIYLEEQEVGLIPYQL